MTSAMTIGTSLMLAATGTSAQWADQQQPLRPELCCDRAPGADTLVQRGSAGGFGTGGGR